MAGIERLICHSQDLIDGGQGVRFDLPELGARITGFAIRFNGKVYAYINRCAHVPIELDWNHGEFFDFTQQYLICATHGAHYQPDTGYCVAGPCRGQMLEPIQAREQDDTILINLES
ncbi:Rieske 2Fe-2S domain-containing protein [Methylobacillus gramineus]|uniref:Rieske (2Fe-2S) protein n=1 Tax=Methylobacillus gramineus TaxID=755169 RepID=UPI001CFFD2B4|nr:Rieske 2Fe-2S domain-containing protein [Methylobacillus gramineus]MCB5184239.1 Rieske 2Fe-2S domain-containing protein [Methylobacillus gramineus]